MNVLFPKLKEIHTATHPGKPRTARLAAGAAPTIEMPEQSAALPPTAEAVLAALAAEAAEEDDEA